MNLSRSPFSYKQKSIAKKVLLVIAILIVIAFGAKALQLKAKNTTATAQSNAQAIAQTQLNKSYSFNARNDQGKPIDKKPLKMTILSAELNKTILIKGTPVTARDGKAFLILAIDVENTYQERLFLPVNDLIRWQDGDKLRSPDVHNNLVLIDPISTKNTRVGFLVDQSTRSFQVKIGEINGEKQSIDIKL